MLQYFLILNFFVTTKKYITFVSRIIAYHFMKRIVNTKPQTVVYGGAINNITHCILGVYPPPLSLR